MDRCTYFVLRLESFQENKETQTKEYFQAKINDLIKTKESLEEGNEIVKAAKVGGKVPSKACEESNMISSQYLFPASLYGK